MMHSSHRPLPQGLGKTLEVISLILLTAPVPCRPPPAGRADISTTSRASLIVVPEPLLAQVTPQLRHSPATNGAHCMARARVLRRLTESARRAAPSQWSEEIASSTQPAELLRVAHATGGSGGGRWVVYFAGIWSGIVGHWLGRDLADSFCAWIVHDWCCVGRSSSGRSASGARAEASTAAASERSPNHLEFDMKSLLATGGAGGATAESRQRALDALADHDVVLTTYRSLERCAPPTPAINRRFPR
jgi:hypothetical protein